VVDVPICAKLVQLAPVQRCTTYPVAPVEAVQVRLIWLEEITEFARLLGAVGNAAVVVPVVVFEKPLLPTALVASTR
jgi:hypothetical protein